MKTRLSKQPQAYRKIVYIITTIIVVSLGYVGVAYAIKSWPFQQPNTTSIESTSPNQNTSKDDLPVSQNGDGKTTDQVPVDPALTATITTLEQKDGIITFMASISSTQTDGTCSVTFSNPNDKPVTRTASAIAENNSSVCGPIQIPETEFAYLGTWTATFRYFVGEKQVSTAKDITIQ